MTAFLYVLLCIFLFPFVVLLFGRKDSPLYKEESTGYLIPIVPIGKRCPYYEPDYEGCDDRLSIMIGYSDYDDNDNIFRVVPAWHHGKEIQTISEVMYSPKELCSIFRIDPTYELVRNECVETCTGNTCLECTWRKV